MPLPHLLAMSNIDSSVNSHMLYVGQQCHSSQCYLVDFLPFKCDHCHHSYCAEHYNPEAHACEKFDASKHNRVAPSCPLCDTPIAIPPNEDPNLRMERHIETDCPVATGRKAKTSSVPICAKSHCGKKLFAPIKCQDCNQQFCPTHRHASSHDCSKSPTQATSSTTMQALAKAKSAVSSSLSSTNPVSSTLNKAMKAAQATTSPRAPPPTAATTTPAVKTSLGSSFKTDRSLSPIPSPTDTPASPPSPRCKPLHSILTTSWVPRSMFGTA